MNARPGMPHTALSLQPNLVDPGPPFSRLFWVLVVLTGLLAGLAASGLMALLYTVEHLAWGTGGPDFLHLALQATWAHRFAILLGAGVLVGGAKLFLWRHNKGHAGDLSEAIWMREGELTALPTLANAILSMVVVGLGASLGREGALKQTGGVLASKLSLWGGLPPEQRRLLVACGAGAGMAAAYNMPLGGALFALEVLLGTISLNLVLPAVTASVCATAVSWLFLPNRPTYQLALDLPTAPFIVWAILAGPLLGLFSVGYIRLIAWVDEIRLSGWRIVIYPFVGFSLLGLAGGFFPRILGNGRDLIQELYSTGLPLQETLLLLLMKTLAIACCLACGAPGGLFTPTLTCGALLGAVLGAVWSFFLPGTPLAAFAMVGAGATLAATAKSPVSALVISAELAWRVDSMIVPLMLAVAGAEIVAQYLEPRSIYTARHWARLGLSTDQRKTSPLANPELS